MKLLFDENLSRKLSVRLAALYPGSVHVAEAGLQKRSDREIWEFARQGGFLLVSADSDFYELATTVGPPPKVVWLRRWSHPTRDAEELLRREAIRIADCPASNRDLLKRRYLRGDRGPTPFATQIRPLEHFTLQCRIYRIRRRTINKS